MRHIHPRALAPLAVAALALAAGCAPFPLAEEKAPPPARVQLVDRAAEATSALSVNTASGSVALGGEFTRTGDGVSGRVWAMSTSGKADLTGMPPLVAFAVDGAGKRTKLMEMAPFPKGSGAVIDARASFGAKLPAGTTAIVVTTGLRQVGAADAAAVLEVPLSEIPAGPSLAD